MVTQHTTTFLAVVRAPAITLGETLCMRRACEAAGADSRYWISSGRDGALLFTRILCFDGPREDADPLVAEAFVSAFETQGT